MTNRVSAPDTNTDLALYDRLNSEATQHFVMVAGAGSGKTTSLIKALMHIKSAKGKHFRVQGQKIACITYTEVAVEEIKSDIGRDGLFHVSTIHSFLWTVVKPFQSDIRKWVYDRLDSLIYEENEKSNNPRSREATREKAAEKIDMYLQQKKQMNNIKRYVYGTGSDYAEGILGHSDILKIGPHLINSKESMRKIFVKKYPVVFVDESQDTDPDFVDALLMIAKNETQKFCLGFFGDPVQKIYLQGKGSIPTGENWQTFRKPENFRCSQKVLQVINNIRADDDGLLQTGGCTEKFNGEQMHIKGSARVIILPADVRRQERLYEARQWLAEQDIEVSWLEENEEHLRVLVLVHRMAAERLGFPNIYSSLNDRSTEELKSGLLDGTVWVLRPFLTVLLPLILAFRVGKNFEVIRILREHCPSLQPGKLADKDVVCVLSDLREILGTLNYFLEKESQKKIGDVVSLILDQNLLLLDELFSENIKAYTNGVSVEVPTKENAINRLLHSDAFELWGYREYIEKLSPFATQQSIKGAEFEKVLVIIDDEQGRTTTFSYGKYFGVVELSDRDKENIEKGIDSVVDRTRRLFYVCCSRARRDLCVIIFSKERERMREAIIEKGFFESEAVHLL